MNKIPLSKINEEEFDSLTFESSNAVLVFFGVKKCTVCQAQLPIIEEIAFDYKDKLKVYWVDVDKYKSLFYRFRLQGIPNILIFYEGEVKERIRGLNSKETFIALIDNIFEEEG